MSTNQDLLRVYREVMAAKTAGQSSVNIDGYTFNMRDQGMCQKCARCTFEAATGRPMPGKDATAQKTCNNLTALAGTQGVNAVSRADLLPGDFVYLHEGSVGHVGIFIDDSHVFQDTIRDGLGITDENFTDGQWARFLAAFRLLPVVADATQQALWGLVVNYDSGAVLGTITVAGMHNDTGRVYFTPEQRPDEIAPPGLLTDADIWGLCVSLSDGSVLAPILPSGINRATGRVYVRPYTKAGTP